MLQMRPSHTADPYSRISNTTQVGDLVTFITETDAVEAQHHHKFVSLEDSYQKFLAKEAPLKKRAAEIGNINID